MKACILHSPGNFEVGDLPKPALKPGYALVRVEACGVCGSDIPRIFGNAAHRTPLVPGHEFCGIVEEVSEPDSIHLVGKRVVVFPLIPCRVCGMCELGEYALCENYDYLGSRSNGGFAEYVAAPVWNLLPIPEGVPAIESAMTEPMAVALHALNLGQLKLGETLVIFGAGPIGLMLAMLGSLMGASRVCLIDIDTNRLNFCKSLGFENVFDATCDNFLDAVRECCGGAADLVIEGAGVSSALENSLLVARPFGKVVLMGNPIGEMKISQRAYWAVLRKQLHLRGTWNSIFNSSPKNEWKKVLNLLAKKCLGLEKIVTHRPTLDELPDLLKKVANKEIFSCKIVVQVS